MNRKGNIVLALLISLLLVTSTLSIYIGFTRDKRNSEMTIERMKEKVEMNAYIVAAQTSIFDYLNTMEIPIVYVQYISSDDFITEGPSGDEVITSVIHRVAITDPTIVDVSNIEPVYIIGMNGETDKKTYECVLLREDKNANFAGYQYDMKIAFDYPMEQASQVFRVANLMEDDDASFWEDNNIYLKPDDAYSVRLKDLRMIIVVNYKTWEQHVKVVIKGLEFKREPFETIMDPQTGQVPAGSSDISDNTLTGISRGVIVTDNATMEVIESYRFRVRR